MTDAKDKPRPALGGDRSWRITAGMVVFDRRVALDARYADGFDRNRFRVLRRDRPGDTYGPARWWLCMAVNAPWRQIWLPPEVLVRVYSKGGNSDGR